jgi:hypothetical protein
MDCLTRPTQRKKGYNIKRHASIQSTHNTFYWSNWPVKSVVLAESLRVSFYRFTDTPTGMYQIKKRYTIT